MTLRFFILTSHYRSTTDFTEEALSAASTGYQRLMGVVDLTRQQLGEASTDELPDGVFEDVLQQHRERFLVAMDDDFNTPRAVAVLFDFGREVNKLLNHGQPVGRETLKAIDGFFGEMGGSILGIVPEETATRASAGIESQLIELLISLRAEARERKEWATSDAIRDEMARMGVDLEDRPEGTTWRLTR